MKMPKLDEVTANDEVKRLRSILREIVAIGLKTRRATDKHPFRNRDIYPWASGMMTGTAMRWADGPSNPKWRKA